MQSLLTIDSYSVKGQQKMLLTGWNYLGNMYAEFYARGDSSFPLYLPVSTVMWLSRAQSEGPSAKLVGIFVHAVEHGVVTIKNITETFSEEISSQVKACRRCPKMLADEPAGAESTLLRSVYDHVHAHKNPTVVAVLLARTLAEFGAIENLPQHEQDAFLQTAQARIVMHRGVIQSGYFLVKELSKKITHLEETLSQ